MRRTVNDARAPSPRRRMTMPSKSCVRSFSPSTTLTSTRTVSPGPNPSRSFLICPASTKRIASMTSSLSLGCGGVDLLRRLPTLESFDEPPLVGCQIRVLQEVRPGPPRDPERLHPPPPRDPRVIPGAEHRRDAGARCGERVHRGEQRLGLEHHAAAAAELVVVGDPVLAPGVVSEIHHPDVNEPARPRATEHRRVEHRLDHAREQRHDVDPHPAPTDRAAPRAGGSPPGAPRDRPRSRSPGPPGSDAPACRPARSTGPAPATARCRSPARPPARPP